MKKQGLKICLNLMINWYNLFYKIVEDSASILFVYRISHIYIAKKKSGARIQESEGYYRKVFKGDSFFNAIRYTND